MLGQLLKAFLYKGVDIWTHIWTYNHEAHAGQNHGWLLLAAYDPRGAFFQVKLVDKPLGKLPIEKLSAHKASNRWSLNCTFFKQLTAVRH